MNTYLRDIVRYRALETPNKTAVLDLDSRTEYTWEQLHARARAMAGFLSQTLELPKGARVGFLCGNGMTLIDAFFAALMTGIVLDTFNHRLIASELATMANREDLSALFFTRETRGKAYAMRNALAHPCRMICIDGPASYSEYSLKDQENDQPFTESYAHIDEGDPLMLIHTGGSTGLPKAAVLSVHNVFMNAISQVLTWGIDASWGTYACMPMFHTTGWNILTIPTLFAGGRLAISKEFSEMDFFDLAQDHRITVFSCADVMMKRIARHPRFRESDLSGIKFAVCGGGPLSRESLEAFWSKEVRVFSGYGMSEVGPFCLTPLASTSLAENKRKPFSVGRPMVFTEIRLVDEEGQDVPVGKEGELLLRGESMCDGYWNAPSASKEAFSQGWFLSGDIAVVDADGDVSICGRKKNMYISGGENVYPTEIERVLEQHPDVREACVIGVPDECWGEVGKALIVPERPGLSAAELRAWTQNRLSTIKRPHYYQLVDSIPTNSAGKRDLKKVRELYSRIEES